MYRISARISGALAACLAAAALVGCATAPAAGKPGAPATSVGTPAACLRTTTITQAGNGKTYCFRVGEKLDVFLRGTLASRWQEPQVSGDVLRGVPNGALSLVAGLTGASYATVRPGRAVLTSVRPPCPGGGSCAPDHRFRAVIIVLGLCACPAGVGLRAGPGLVFGVGDQVAPLGLRSLALTRTLPHGQVRTSQSLSWNSLPMVMFPFQGTCPWTSGRVSVIPGTDRALSAARAERTVVGMDNRNEIRDFLVSRRARITPEQAGLPGATEGA